MTSPRVVGSVCRSLEKVPRPRPMAKPLFAAGAWMWISADASVTVAEATFDLALKPSSPPRDEGVAGRDEGVEAESDSCCLIRCAAAPPPDPQVAAFFPAFPPPSDGKADSSEMSTGFALRVEGAGVESFDLATGKGSSVSLKGGKGSSEMIAGAS